MGGLGNQMFQYACGLAIRKKYGGLLKIDPYYLFNKDKRSFRFCHRDYGLDIFHITAEIATPHDILHFTIPRVMNKYIYHALNRIYPQRNVYSEDKFTFSEIPGNSYIIGYWQKAEILSYADSEIRKEFRLREELICGCDEIARMIQQSEHPVCVSFRRGDYVGHPTLGFLTLDYYREAISELARIIPCRKQYYVFSDDIPWCKSNFSIGNQQTKDSVFFVDQKYTGEKYQNYFYLMMLCSSFIIPNSTYPFWAAYLSNTPNKHVIAPATWFKGQTCKRNNILPREWIAL